MRQLNLPAYQFNVKRTEKGLKIWDDFRKRFVKLTPEEWVRQHFLRFLTDERGYPAALLAVEVQFNVNGMKKRCDAVVYDRQARPRAIIELKAPDVPITQAVFDQAAVYNSQLHVELLMISNGLEHYCCYVDEMHGAYRFLESIPPYHELFCTPASGCSEG